MKYLSSTHYITSLLLGGAFVLGAPSCGGRAGENSASGGEASTMSASSDEDGDGVLDSLGKTVDQDKDGKPDQIDVDGDGQDDGVAVDTDGDGKPDGAGLDTDGDGIIDAIDTDGDGKPDEGGNTSGDGDGDKGSGGESGDGDGDTTSNGDGSGGKESGDGDGDGSGGSSNNNANPGVKTLGDSCTNPGALACAGENQKLQLLCDGSGEWVQNGTCAGIAVCDTGEANRGSCQEPIAGCVDREPRERYCMGWGDIMECNVDRTASSLVESCSIGCVDGECSPVDDPCPEGGGAFDCSLQCEDPQFECDENPVTACRFLSVVTPFAVEIGPIRIPAAPDVCELDGQSCQKRVFPVIFSDGVYFRLLIPDDWDAVVTKTFNGYSDEHGADACDAERVQGCVVLHEPIGTFPSILFIPKTDNAAARNIQVEVLNSNTGGESIGCE